MAVAAGAVAVVVEAQRCLLLLVAAAGVAAVVAVAVAAAAAVVVVVVTRNTCGFKPEQTKWQVVLCVLDWKVVHFNVSRTSLRSSRQPPRSAEGLGGPLRECRRNRRKQAYNDELTTAASLFCKHVVC